MSLTVASGPFSKRPTGELNFPVEPSTGSVLLWWPVPQRIRALVGDETVVDSRNAKLLHETGYLPVYYFPDEEVRFDLLEPSERRTHCPHKGDASYWTIRAGERAVADAVWAYREPIEPAAFLSGHVALYWHLADEWFAEDDELFGHPRDPFHRIDVHPTTRRVRVLLDGEVLAETTRAQALFETSLPPRWYMPPEDVRMELLEPSESKTRCAYKGSASYWNVRVGDRFEDDLVWTYAQPKHDAEQVRGMLCFFNERVDLELDGVVGERPHTQWSRGPSARYPLS
jgi:uncharacterized protein (DUF427 family)